MDIAKGTCKNYISSHSAHTVSMFTVCKHVQIDCNLDDCTLRYIDGSLAASLTVNCTGSGCEGTQIVCPVSDEGSNCTVDCSVDSCQYLYIQSAAGGDMDSFKFLCGAQSVCKYTQIELDPDSISNITIQCSARVCDGLSVFFEVIVCSKRSVMFLVFV